jgi:hypothetical protein
MRLTSDHAGTGNVGPDVRSRDSITMDVMLAKARPDLL